MIGSRREVQTRFQNGPNYLLSEQDIQTLAVVINGQCIFLKKTLEVSTWCVTGQRLLRLPFWLSPTTNILHGFNSTTWCQLQQQSPVNSLLKKKKNMVNNVSPVPLKAEQGLRLDETIKPPSSSSSCFTSCSPFCVSLQRLRNNGLQKKLKLL